MSDLHAWAAGLFEGEGCVTRSGRSVRLSLETTDEDVLYRFGAIVRIGSISRRERVGRKPLYRWHVQGVDQVRCVMAMLEPWLGARRRARLAEVLAWRDKWERERPHLRDVAGTLRTGRPIGGAR